MTVSIADDSTPTSHYRDVSTPASSHHGRWLTHPASLSTHTYLTALWTTGPPPRFIVDNMSPGLFRCGHLIVDKGHTVCLIVDKGHSPCLVVDKGHSACFVVDGERCG